VDDDPGVAYDEDLVHRIRELIAAEPDVTEGTMFGGVVFLADGKMLVAAGGQGSLVVRVDPGETDAVLAKPHARPFEMGGREMPGRLRICTDGGRTKRQLEPWLRALCRVPTLASVEAIAPPPIRCSRGQHADAISGVDQDWAGEAEEVTTDRPREPGAFPRSLPPPHLRRHTGGTAARGNSSSAGFSPKCRRQDSNLRHADYVSVSHA
jgi:TfoX N-terminal domain